MNAINVSKLGRHVLLVLALALPASSPVQASLIISAGSTAANAGSTGNAFDITLVNTGPDSITLGAFSVGISVANSNVSFTSATTATLPPYVFAGDSLYGPTISTSAPGQILDASDLCVACINAIASGATVGLAHVFFDVLAGAPAGPLAVSFAAFPTTSLSDSSGNDLAVTTVQDGTITINGPGVPVPEPSTLALLALSVPLLARKRFLHR